MRYFAPFLIIALLSIFGFQPLQAQVDMSGFESLFKNASATAGSSIGGGGTTTSTTQNQQDGRDGGGSIDMINANWPVAGKMVNRKTILSWNEGQQPKIITLKRGSDVIFKSPVTGKSIEIDFSKFDLDTLKTYNLQLSNDSLSSKRTALNFVDHAKFKEAMMELEAMPEYKNAVGTKKALMKAFFLEKKEFNYEAYEAYHIPTSDPVDMEIILTFFNDFKSRN